MRERESKTAMRDLPCDGGGLHFSYAVHKQPDCMRLSITVSQLTDSTSSPSHPPRFLLPLLFLPVSSFSTLPPSLRSDFDLLSSRKAELLLIKSWHGVYKHGDKPGCKVRDREKRAEARDVSVQGAFHPLFQLTGSWTRSPTVRLSAGAPVTIRTTKNDLPPLSNLCL